VALAAGKLSYANSKLDKASAREAKARGGAAAGGVRGGRVSPGGLLQDITRLINERNELEYARKATQSGGSLTVVREAAELPEAAAAP